MIPSIIPTKNKITTKKPVLKRYKTYLQIIELKLS